jgi:ATP-dependent helicase HrpB
MSATLDAAPIAAHLHACPILRSEGKLHPLTIDWTPDSAQPLEDRVAAAVERLVREGVRGDVLVFLPGAYEMRRAAAALAGVADRHQRLITQLHGDLSPEEQDRALAPAPRPKIILSTNVAESSITIEGVTAVVDSGLARIAVDSPWTGIPSIEVSRIAQSSATQRAGRSARTAPGRVIRLYTREEFARRPVADQPEIARRELSHLLLDLHGCGIADPLSLPWLTPPPQAALEAGESLLERLGAVRNGRMTAPGARMAKIPLHPRLSRFVIEAEKQGCGDEGARAAAALSAGERLDSQPKHHVDSDLILLIEQRWQPGTYRIADQIRRATRISARRGKEEALPIAVLAAFSDRLGRKSNNGEVLLAAGGAARLSPSSGVQDASLLVALDIENRKERGQPLIRLASRASTEWLLDLFPDRVDTREGVEWNRSRERVEQVSAWTFDGFVLEESRAGNPDPQAAAELLAEKAIESGLETFVDPEAWQSLMNRWRFAANWGAPPPPDEDTMRQTLAQACSGLRSFAELRAMLGGGGLEGVLLTRFAAADLDRMNRIAPERIRLPSGRHAKVQYAEGQPPWVASRLQDFFGMKETPRIAEGKVSLVVHLLAPNQRPVQMTQDLEGFWRRLYPSVRKELGRRYPRHAWPEDPFTPAP